MHKIKSRNILSHFLPTFKTVRKSMSSHRANPSGDRPQTHEVGYEVEYENAVAILNQYQKRPPLGQTRTMSARDRTKMWLTLLGHKLDLPRIIHIAGSKGKGTTSYYCNHILNKHRILTAGNYKIGCYTSPHQVEVRERIQINGEKISKQLFASYVCDLHEKLQSNNEIPKPGYPGFLALLAPHIFASEDVHIAVIETGIGGEYDSTNVFPSPIAAGITTIGLDHVNTLGTTLEQIAWHKGGIFKSGSPALSVTQDDRVLEVLRQRANEKDCHLQIVSDKTLLKHGASVVPDMRYQRLNASLAIELADIYLKSAFPEFVAISEIARTLPEVNLPGRSQIINRSKDQWYISIAHNVDSLRETINWYMEAVVASKNNNPRIVVFNQNRNISSPRDPFFLLKEIHNTLGKFTLQTMIFCSDQSYPSGKETPDLIDLREDLGAPLKLQQDNADIWRSLGGSGRIIVAQTIKEAIGLVESEGQGASVLVTGSSFLVGRLLHIFQAESKAVR